MGEQVHDVPAALSMQVRKLSGAGHKTDAHDARPTAIAGRHATRLRPVTPDGAPQLLRLLVERRWHIVDTRQKALVRIHEQLVKLIPGGHSRQLSTTKVAKLLRGIRPAGPIGQLRRRIIKELLAELRVLDRRRSALNAELDQMLDDYGTCLTDIDGIRRTALG